MPGCFECVGEFVKTRWLRIAVAHFLQYLFGGRVFCDGHGFDLVVYERLPEFSSVLSALAKGGECEFEFGFGIRKVGVQQYRIPAQEGADLEKNGLHVGVNGQFADGCLAKLDGPTSCGQRCGPGGPGLLSTSVLGKEHTLGDGAIQFVDC